MFPVTSIIHLKSLRMPKLNIQAVSKKNTSENNLDDALDGESTATSKRTQRAPRRSRKKANAEIPEDNSVESVSSLDEEGKSITASADDSKKVKRRGRRKGVILYLSDFLFSVFTQLYQVFKKYSYIVFCIVYYIICYRH